MPALPSLPIFDTSWAVLASGVQVKLASPAARAAARILDWLIVPAVLLLLLPAGFHIAAATGAGGEAVLSGVKLTAAAVGLLYEVTLIALTGQTLGKMAMRVKVVRVESGGVPGAVTSIVRWLVPAAVSWLPVVGVLAVLVYASMLWDSNRQGWHDKAAGTLVVSVG